MTLAFIPKPGLLRDEPARLTLRTISRQPLRLASADEPLRSRAPIGAGFGRLAAIAALAVALGSSVSGCAVGPDYQAPSIVLGAFHNVGAVRALEVDAPPPPLDTWWTGFNDPALTRIVRRALDQNLDLAASLARVDQARAAAREADARLLPTADLTAQALKRRQSLESPIGAIGKNLPGFSRDLSLFDLGVGAGWEIDLFGGLRRGAEAASAEAEAAEAARVATQILVAAEAFPEATNRRTSCAAVPTSLPPSAASRLPTPGSARPSPNTTRRYRSRGSSASRA